ncbi:MAG: HNH endonuclease [Geminicoccaceae bacterium]
MGWLWRRFVVRPVTSVWKRPRRGAKFDVTIWRRVRLRALKRDGARCVGCGRGSSDGVTLEVDHIKPKSQYPNLMYDLANLQTLCYDCHRPKGTRIFNWRKHYDSHAPQE